MSNNQTHTSKPTLPYYVAMYKSHAVTINRDADYEATIKLVQSSITKLRSVNARDIFISTILSDYGDLLVQLSKEIWPDVVEQLNAYGRDKKFPTEFRRKTGDTEGTKSQSNNPPSIFVRTISLKLLEFNNVSPSLTVRSFKALIQTQLNLPATLQSLGLMGKHLDDNNQ
ncbi:hypothetical protein FRC07_003720 [Ceratobasidium sp. 392]|nr:hypothetical protein FRC07_003720 [Ceratobasidium sp. 392]